MTQATPSQFELEDLPPLHEVSQSFILDQLGGESVKQSTVVPILSIDTNAVTWRVDNGSSVYNQC